MNEILSIFNDYAGVISFVTLLATLFSIWYAWRNNKDSIRQQIESKEAELESINSSYFNPITARMGFPEKMQMEARKKTLEKEIKQLKKRL
jgi:hypothetical protein